MQSAHLSNAGANPGAMMIEFHGAIVADCTVRAAGRPIHLAGCAPLCGDRVPVDVVLPRRRMPPVQSATWYFHMPSPR